MRFLAGLFAASFLLLAACRTMPDLSHNPAQSAFDHLLVVEQILRHRPSPAMAL